MATTTSASTTGIKSSVGIPTAPPTSKITSPPITGIGESTLFKPPSLGWRQTEEEWLQDFVCHAYFRFA